MHVLRVSHYAAEDMESILRWTMEQFGEPARLRYEALLDQALVDIASDPFRAGSAARPLVGANVRVYHISGSKRRSGGSQSRVKQPRHLFLYEIVDTTVRIVRVLHERMDIERHLSDTSPSNDNDPATPG